MMSNEPRTLPEWIKEAYEILAPGIQETPDGVSRERAEKILLDDDEFPDEPADATHALNRLLDSGWLYEVNSLIRVTDPDR